MESSKQLLKGIAIGVIISAFAAAIIFWGSAVYRSVFGYTLDKDEKLIEMMDVIEDNYVGDIEKSELMEGVYRGVAEEVGDPYTTYMTPQEYSNFFETMSGSFAGVGLYIFPNSEDGSITVSQPIKNSPGEAAGLLADDRILKVDGKEYTAEEIDDAILHMKGDPGTKVTLTMFRKSTGKTFDTEIIREVIDVPSVEYKMVDDNIGYIAISTFDDHTYTQFKQAYDDLNSKGQKGLIIDVRNNLGGYFDKVVDISDLLLPDCTIVYREDHNGKRVYDKSSDKEYFDKPMVLLINGASASASEILAGALKDNGAAELVGTTTFGKGLVQKIFKLKDKSAVKVTIEKYFTPSGVCINGIGIEPDYEVKLPDNLDEPVKMTEENDTQFSKAVDIINSKATAE